MGKLYVVGFGPGGYEHMTAKCIDVIKNADVVTGYTTYVNILKEYFPDKNYIATPMMQEVKRCEMAVEEAMKDQTVAMVSSGDSGIWYGRYHLSGGRGKRCADRDRDCSGCDSSQCSSICAGCTADA